MSYGGTAQAPTDNAPTLHGGRYQVSDLMRSVEWCVDVLGAEAAKRSNGPHSRNVALAIDGFELELIETTESSEVLHNAAHDAPGAYHICLEATDIDAAYSRLRDLDVTFTTFANRPYGPFETAPGLWTLYFRDPDGFLYQALARSRSSTGTARGSPMFDRGVHHVGYNVTRLDSTLAWYERAWRLRVDDGHGRDGMSGIYPNNSLSNCAALIPAGGSLLELTQWDSWRGGQLTSLNAPLITLEVTDVTAIRRQLEHEGSQFMTEYDHIYTSRDSPGGRYSFVTADPDGLPVQAITKQDDS